MMEMGTAYLPINQNWERYLNQSDAVYDDLQNELSRLLQKLANEACELLHDKRYIHVCAWFYVMLWAYVMLLFEDKIYVFFVCS